MPVSGGSAYRPSAKEVDAWVARVSEINEAVNELLHSDPMEDMARVEAREKYRKEWEDQQQKARLELVKMRYEPKYYGRFENDQFIEELLKKVDEDRKPGRDPKRMDKVPLLQNPSLYSKAERLSLEEAYRLKDKGLEHMKNQQWDEAYKAYNGALQLNIDGMDPPLSIKLHNNRACVLNKLGRHRAVCEDTTYVLQRDPSNVKALLRRATALRFLHRPVEALNDVSQALRIEPKNPEGLHLRTWLQRAEEELLWSDRFVEEGSRKSSAADGSFATSIEKVEPVAPLLGRQPERVVDSQSEADTLKAAGEFLSASSLGTLLQDASLLKKTLRTVEKSGVGAAAWFALQGGVTCTLSTAITLLQEWERCMDAIVSLPSCEEGGVCPVRSTVLQEGTPREDQNPSAANEDANGNSVSSTSSSASHPSDRCPPAREDASLPFPIIGGTSTSSSAASSVASRIQSGKPEANTVAVPLIYCLRLIAVLFDGCETVSQDASEQHMKSLIQHLIVFVFGSFIRVEDSFLEDSCFTKVLHASLECLTTLYDTYANLINASLEESSEGNRLFSLWNALCLKKEEGGKVSGGSTRKNTKEEQVRRWCTMLYFTHFLSACLKAQGTPIYIKREKQKKMESVEEAVKKGEEGATSLSSSPSSSSLSHSTIWKVGQQLFFDAIVKDLKDPSEVARTVRTSSDLIMEVMGYCLQQQLPLPLQSAGMALALRRSSIQVFVLPASLSSYNTGSMEFLSSMQQKEIPRLEPMQWSNPAFASSLCSAFSGVLQTCRRGLSSSISLSSELHFLEAFYSLLYNLCLSAPDRSAFVKQWEALCTPLTMGQLSWEYAEELTQYHSAARSDGSERVNSKEAEGILSSVVLPKLMAVLGKFVPHSSALQQSICASTMVVPMLHSSAAGTSGNTANGPIVETGGPTRTEEISPLWKLLYCLSDSSLAVCHPEGGNQSRWELLQHLSSTLGVLVRLQKQSGSSSAGKQDADPNSGTRREEVVRSASCAGHIRAILSLLPVCLPPSEERVLLWKESSLTPTGPSLSHRHTSHLSMPLVTLGNMAIITATIMDISSAFAKEGSSARNVNPSSSVPYSSPADDYNAVLKVLKEKDAVGVLLHSLRTTRSSVLLLARERAEEEKRRKDTLISQLRTWEEHAIAAQKNLGIAISKVVTASGDMRARLRELNGLETLAAVLQQGR